MTWGHIPVAEIKERQGRKLHQFLSKKVYPYCPYYQRVFDQHGIKPDSIRKLEDLRRLPFTTKADIVPSKEEPDRYRDIILQPSTAQIRDDLTITDKIALWAKSKLFLRTIQDQVLDEYLPVHITFTTGRTSLPTPFVYTISDLEALQIAGERMFRMVGLERTHDRGLNAMPFAPHLAFWQVVHASQKVGLMLLHSGGGRVMGSEAQLRIGERTKPTFLVGTPGYIMHLGQLAEEMGIRITTIRKIILGAERVAEEHKVKLREQYARIGCADVKIHNIYGFTEAKHAWAETADEPDSRFATYPDLEIFEIIDPDTGEPVGEGEPGEIVFTQLSGAGSVVLRYRTGDRVKEGLIYDKCPYTGLILPLLGTGLYRVSEIKKVKGTLVDFNEMFSFFNGQREIVDWQLVLSKPDGQELGNDIITLRVTLADDADKAGFEDAIKRSFKELTEVSLDRVEHYGRTELSELLGMDTKPKEARIVDERPQ
ncbi:phenylacetate--CoA ligase family protein [bacterium]|nr:phenylacetate--CoA ligase family protein [bacterium]